MTADAPLLVTCASDLDVPAALEVVDGRALELAPRMRGQVERRRSAVLDALRDAPAVYGVNTGMGAASDLRLDDDAQAQQQSNLMLARAVGSAPWLDPTEARAALVVRLRTFLGGDAGVSAELCSRLVRLLDHGLCPAIPRSRVGAAGEIIPLAHLGGALTGSGEFLDRQGTRECPGTRPAAEVLSEAGIERRGLGPKEGVALLQGVPITTALAILRTREVRALVDQTVAVLAAELALVAATRDTFAAATARADDELALVLGAVRRLAGPGTSPRALQAPVSFRVSGPALAQALRSVAAADAAVERAVLGVTDSPAFLDGRFVGTAGFDGFDLAAALDALRVSVLHLAELSTARLHRLLDDRVTGLPRQLSGRPGLHAGMVVVHKRAVGVTHALLTAARPACVGAVETSLGQEDVQSFSLEAASACAAAIEGARDVLAGELLAVIQGARLAPSGLPGPGPLTTLLSAAADALPAGTEDRPFGRDLATIDTLLRRGWARGALRAEPSAH